MSDFSWRAAPSRRACTAWHLWKKCVAVGLLALLLLVPANGLIAPAVGFAQLNDEVKQETVDNWLSQLQRIEKNVEILQYDDPGLTRLQEEAQKLLLEIEKYRSDLAPRLAEVKSQIDKLGPEPAKDAPEEAAAIQTERQRLNDSFKQVDAAIKRAGVAATQTTQLISRIQETRRTVFARQLFKRQTLLFRASGWSTLITDAGFGWNRLKSYFAEWLEKASPIGRLFWLLVGALVYFFGAQMIAGRLVDRLRRPPNGDEPVFFHRAQSAASVSLLRMIPALTTLAGIYIGLNIFDALTPPVGSLLGSLLRLLIILVVVASLATTLLAPNRAMWRMLPVVDRDARRLTWLIIGMAFVYAFNQFGGEINTLISAPLTLTLLLSLISSVLFAVFLVLVLRVPFGMREVDGIEEPAHVLWPSWLKVPLWLVAAAIVIALPLGYFALAQFLAGQVVLTGAVVLMVVIFHMAIGELRHDLVDERRGLGRWAHNQLRLELEPRKLLAFGLSFGLNLLLIVVAVPLVLANWGFSSADMQSWLVTMFYGFDIGGFRFSMAAIMAGVALFALGIVLTRFLQRWLDQGILKSPRIQSGLSNSIRTGIGYMGFLLSALLAVSYVGLDFTNLAIVAGALSVGIGFGLQSIVNNFVSGLILLVERPVKVGDWVIVGENQGFVRRISVRSTEIETFDRSTVIVPNSELITGVVTNWTHGNSTGRVIVRVGVAYHSNPREVYSILMEIAKAHPKSLTYPAPRVVFEDFGASSLDFSIRTYIGNITELFDVTTELRMQIFERFKEHEIEISFPQLDVHLKR